MPAISAPNLAILRNSHPHYERFRLSIFKPSMVYIANVAGSPARGDTTIHVTDVDGALAGVMPGHTMYVYYHSTGVVVSKRRVRSTGAGTILVDENNVNWSTAMDIKVVDDYALWSIFPYIDPATLIFYKDRDIPYVDQNTYPSPVAIIHAERVKMLTGASVTFDIDGSDSYAIADGATIVSYAWTAQNGTFADFDAATTTLTITVAGQYWLYLTVTDSNGKTQTQQIVLFVHEETGANAPYYDFTVESIDADLTNGGASYNVTINGLATEDDIPEETLVILSSEQHYGSTSTPIGFSKEVVCVGYIKSETVYRQYDAGTVSFVVETIHGLMKRRKMVSVSLEEADTVDSWYKFPNGTLTVARAMHHYFKHHSTLLNICNVILPVDDTRTMTACDDFEAGTLFDTTSRFASDYSIMALMYSTLYGTLYVERNINTLDDTARAARTTTFDVQAIDRMVDPDIQIMRRTDNLSSAIVSGVAIDANGDPQPIISICPGDVPDTYGNSELNLERQVLTDQAEANFLSGRVFAMKNTDVQELRFSLAGNYPVDLMPQEWLRMVDVDNKRIDIEDTNFMLMSMRLVLNVSSGTRTVECVAVPEAISAIGDGITIVPPVPDPSADPPPPINYPPIGIPTYPPLPKPPGIIKPPVVQPCNGEDVPNGPYQTSAYLHLSSLYPSSGFMINGEVTSVMTTRNNANTYKTSAIMKGHFLTNGVNNPANDWYNVYLTSHHQNLALGTVTGNGSTRTISFDLPAPVKANYVRFELQNTTLVNPEYELGHIWYSDEGLGNACYYHPGCTPSWVGHTTSNWFDMGLSNRFLGFDFGAPLAGAGPVYMHYVVRVHNGGGNILYTTNWYSNDGVNWINIPGAQGLGDAWADRTTPDLRGYRYVGFSEYTDYPVYMDMAYCYMENMKPGSGSGVNNELILDDLLLYNICRSW